MKRIIISLAVLLWAIVAFAEDSESIMLPSDRNHLTVSIGYDASIPGNWKLNNGSSKMFKSGSGISVGADYMMLIGNNVFFEPGATFVRADKPIIGSGPVDRSRLPFLKISNLYPTVSGIRNPIFRTGGSYIFDGSSGIPSPIVILL